MSNLLYILATFIAALQISSVNVTKSDTVDIIPIETPMVTDDRENQVIMHTGYSVSYNKETKLPNWVAYELTDAEVAGVISPMFVRKTII